MPLQAGDLGAARRVPQPYRFIGTARGETAVGQQRQGVDRAAVAFQAGGLGARWGQARPLGQQGGPVDQPAGGGQESGRGRVADRHQPAQDLWEKLAPIARTDAAGQAERPADQVWHLALAVPGIIGNERRRAAGGRELGLQPAGIEQQRVQPRPLPGLGEMLGQIPVIVVRLRCLRLCLRPADLAHSPD